MKIKEFKDGLDAINKMPWQAFFAINIMESINEGLYKKKKQEEVERQERARIKLQETLKKKWRIPDAKTCHKK